MVRRRSARLKPSRSNRFAPARTGMIGSGTASTSGRRVILAPGSGRSGSMEGRPISPVIPLVCRARIAAIHVTMDSDEGRIQRLVAPCFPLFEGDQRSSYAESRAFPRYLPLSLFWASGSNPGPAPLSTHVVASSSGHRRALWWRRGGHPVSNHLDLIDETLSRLRNGRPGP